MEKLGVDFVGACWIVNTLYVGAWRVRNARAAVVVKLMMANYTVEKGKKPSFSLKFWSFVLKVAHGKWSPQDLASANSE